MKINPPPKRSVLFMATTAEEAGLLGAKFYAEHPLYPLEKTLADINLDSMNVWGKARDIEDLSLGFSTLDDLLAAAAKQQGRSAIPDSRPDKGKIYRADNFEFSKSACRHFTSVKVNIFSPVRRPRHSGPTNLTHRLPPGHRRSSSRLGPLWRRARYSTFIRSWLRSSQWRQVSGRETELGI